MDDTKFFAVSVFLALVFYLILIMNFFSHSVFFQIYTYICSLCLLLRLCRASFLFHRPLFPVSLICTLFFFFFFFLSVYKFYFSCVVPFLACYFAFKYVFCIVFVVVCHQFICTDVLSLVLPIKMRRHFSLPCLFFLFF